MKPIYEPHKAAQLAARDPFFRLDSSSTLSKLGGWRVAPVYRLTFKGSYGERGVVVQHSDLPTFLKWTSAALRMVKAAKERRKRAA